MTVSYRPNPSESRFDISRAADVSVGAYGRALVPLERRDPPPLIVVSEATDGDEPSRGRSSSDGNDSDTLDVHHISPRQMAALCFDLYVSGIVQWEEYALMAFQPELHPDYPQTIGALTGEKANPDRPRNFIRYWENRLAYERRYNPGDDDSIRAIQRILKLLRERSARNYHAIQEISSPSDSTMMDSSFG